MQIKRYRADEAGDAQAVSREYCVSAVQLTRICGAGNGWLTPRTSIEAVYGQAQPGPPVMVYVDHNQIGLGSWMIWF